MNKQQAIRAVSTRAEVDETTTRRVLEVFFDVVVREVAAGMFPVPVALPPAGEYVALGAARQAAWVASGEAEPPVWGLEVEELTGESRPEVVERYRRFRPWN